MKKLCIVFFGLNIFCICHGQRYEVWVNQAGGYYEAKGYYGYSNDSVLTIYTKSTLFNPSRDYNLNWDGITAINIRNKTKNDIGGIIGTGIGALASYLLLDAESKGKIYLGSEYGGGMIISVGLIGGGALAGYLLTCAKIKIPLDGKSAKEKNQILRNRIYKKS
jgi:hypothetical protein